MSLREKLDKIYRDPSSPGSYRSVRDLYLEAKSQKIAGVTLKKVKDYLRTQDSYTLHARVRKKYPREKTISYGFMDLIQVVVDVVLTIYSLILMCLCFVFQCDLADVQSLSRKNSGIRYLLVVVAVLSKRVWLKPAKKKLSNEIAGLMEEIIREEMPVVPLRCQTDQGSEFIAGPWQNLMKQYSIVHFWTQSKDTKASVAEVTIREIKRIIYRLITGTGSERYIDYLKEIENSHNNRVHPKTNFKPIDVDESNASIIFRKLYPELMVAVTEGKTKGRPRFVQGDRVRVAKEHLKLRHGYLQAWNPEIYVVSKVLPERNPPRFKLKTEDSGEEIIGLWYADEIQKV